ncbi:MAG: 2'-5' RNA ligase family protein [Flavitalea sp.]
MNTRAETNEYLLVAFPDKSTSAKILEERQRFVAEYGNVNGVDSRPAITITNFFANEGMEETLVRWLQKICSLEQGFTLTLNNYSGFPDQSIFMRVLDAAPIHAFLRQLSAMKDFITPALPGFFRRPHIPIASGLKQSVYELAVSEYSKMTFHESFSVKELVLMRKSAEFGEPKTVQVFGLLPAGNDLFNKVA